MYYIELQILASVTLNMSRKFTNEIVATTVYKAVFIIIFL